MSTMDRFTSWVRTQYERAGARRRARQRETGLRILWPSICCHARSVEDSKTVFALHVLSDRAWTDDFTIAELLQQIDALPPAGKGPFHA